ncbi:hypothetical protein ACFQZ4_37815 [Catellatospora coxensis]|uniref:Spore maturation protein CgeB n=1 Tax=Catellatospora coxensis TaxID=310354 RepID=A0A8J3KXC1_9ACTN|nr:hypothetical protein [Catellatospora coxensis]GIG03670.1 hypothetical protein Cco03nite_03700 [Catellatospora coxensis]
MKIGYSFWGFLGPGVTDTPDGGRSHRRTLIDALFARGHDIVFLQPDRDLAEAGTVLPPRYTWDAGLPEIDALMLEWRWPIPGRNDTWCGAPGHTCDLHRQTDLVAHYTHRLRTPTILWDKDRWLPAHDPMRTLPHVAVCEPALHPSPGATSLLFPVSDHALDTADPWRLARTDRHLDLAYVGNQYDRDAMFDQFFAPAAATRPHVVAGKWTDTTAWPQVRFTGRIPFEAVAAIHATSLATVLLLPRRYAAVGHMTQRLFESVLAGCLPITPRLIRSAAKFAPDQLHVRDSADVARICDRLREIKGTREHAELITDCLRYLDMFRVSKQLLTLERILHERVVSAT